ncbi:methionine adenosyltransferase [Candidatus Woesearchaeota archaeon]|nr:MAG: methionine adenosyltransferase [Candidatus Woesearchaeota archaeon]
MINIVVDKLNNNKVEIVEVKGSGHPDTLCDVLTEECSKRLSRYYLKNFGKVLHHNLDKALIVAGKAVPEFNAGKIIEPMKIIIAGRAVTKVGNVLVPIEKIIRNAVEDVMQKFNAPYELEIQVKEGAQNLKQVFKRAIAVANDTSIGVAFYPLTPLEKMVKNTAELISSENFRKKFQGVGYDVKVMGVREGKNVSMTIALAFVSKHIKNMHHYRELKHEIKTYIENLHNVSVHINTLDSYDKIENLYITVTGLSAENGDDGQAGRGNRYNGLITPNRAMSIESYAGKNINHPGKIYQVMAQKIAEDLVKKANSKCVEVMLMTEIGKPLTEPYVVSIKAENIDLRKIKEVVEQGFKDFKKLQKANLL